MQYLKDELRADILRAAVEEFHQNGYQNASMRQIAKRCGITAGNIYRYFKNKDALFAAILEPVWQETVQMLHVVGKRQTIDNMAAGEIIGSIIDICKRHPEVFQILVAKSAGSPYANARDELISLVTDRLDTELLPRLYELNHIEQDPFLTRVLATTVIDSFFAIIAACGDDIPRMEALMERMLLILFTDLDKRTA